MSSEPQSRRFFTVPISSILLGAAPAMVMIVVGAVIGTWWAWLLAGLAVLWLGLLLLGALELRSRPKSGDESEWDEVALYLRRFKFGEARTNADLLEAVEARWVGRVVPRTSWIELLFTPLGDEYPFERALYVGFNETDDAFSFRLMVNDLLVTADKARLSTAPVVLDAFLMQLAQVTLPATRWPCPCCGYLTLDEEPLGTFEICPVCFWEEEGPGDPDIAYGGPNRVSLSEARRNFIAFGASDDLASAHVRPPAPDELPGSDDEHSPGMR